LLPSQFRYFHTRGAIIKRSSGERLSPRDPSARTAISRALEALKVRTLQCEKARVAENRKTDKSLRALRAPFEQLIAESPAASRALKDLRQQQIKDVSGFVRDIPVRDRQGASILDLRLHEHLSVAIPPYDFDWQRGNPQQSIHSKLDGRIGILGRSGHFEDGSGDRIDAAAGIGLAITTDKPAIVSVRPFITYSWEYVVGAQGLFSSGSASGGIDAAAFLNGVIIDGVRRSVLFSDSRGWAGTDQDDGGGITWVPDVTLGFNMDPGQVVVVNFGAWIECDHDSGIGIGGGAGKVQGAVKWIVVERFIAG
jgi:hypothetical protein